MLLNRNNFVVAKYMFKSLANYIYKRDSAPTGDAGDTGDTDTLEQDIDSMIDDFEGDSLIIDEARSGPIQPSPAQYGTSFADAIEYSSNSDFKVVTFNSTFDVDWGKKDTEYEYNINKFYLPSLKQRFHIPQEYVENNFQYSVDEYLKEVTEEKASKETKVSPLQPDELQQVFTLFKNRNSGYKVVSKYQIDLTIRDFVTLKPQQWLNDNIIDFYFNLISDQDSNRIFCWTSHFYSTLRERGYQGVKRWGKRKKLNPFDKPLIFIPININSTHWALAVIDNREKSIIYYDSLSKFGSPSETVQCIRNYLIGEAERLAVKVDVNSYSSTSNVEVPQQRNGFDCGVFACICANYLSQNKPLTYSQEDMPIFRQRMAYEILIGKLLL